MARQEAARRPQARATTAHERDSLEPTESGEFVGQVFKTVNDKFVGNLSFIRVFSGKLDADQPLVNLRTGKSVARRRPAR